MASPRSTALQCGGKKTDGSLCTQAKGWGTDHPGVGRCKLHGGSNPIANTAGVVQLAERRAAVMGVPLDLNPHDAILECIRITAGEVAYASERVAELQADQAVGYVELKTTRPLKEEKGAENPDVRVQETRQESPQLHIWIKVRQQAMDRLVNYSAVAIKAGIEERQIRLVERLGEQLATMFEHVLSAIPGLSEEQRAAGVVALGSQVQLLEAPSVAA